MQGNGPLRLPGARDTRTPDFKDEAWATSILQPIKHQKIEAKPQGQAASCTISLEPSPRATAALRLTTLRDGTRVRVWPGNVLDAHTAHFQRQSEPLEGLKRPPGHPRALGLTHGRSHPAGSALGWRRGARPKALWGTQSRKSPGHPEGLQGGASHIQYGCTRDICNHSNPNPLLQSVPCETLQYTSCRRRPPTRLRPPLAPPRPF